MLVLEHVFALHSAVPTNNNWFIGTVPKNKHFEERKNKNTIVNEKILQFILADAIYDINNKYKSYSKSVRV